MGAFLVQPSLLLHGRCPLCLFFSISPKLKADLVPSRQIKRLNEPGEITDDDDDGREPKSAVL